jgi:hypothetical protein
VETFRVGDARTSWKEQIYLLVLADYVFSLLILGAAAVVFWTMLAKLAAAQGDSSLTAFSEFACHIFWQVSNVP